MTPTNNDSTSADVNLEILRDIADGKEPEMRELSRQYIRNAEDHLERIKAALETGDFRQIKGLAHGLAGSSSMLGIVAMLAPLRRLENLDERADRRMAAPSLEDAYHALARVRSFLEAPWKK